MKKRIALCLIALLLLLPAAGCGEKKNTDPLTVTLWHVYGGEVDSPLNGLIERFNSTIGVEKNIRVKVELVSNSGSIHKSVLAAANSDPGAPTLPDMFVSYPKTVLALPDEDILVDYRDYLSGEELGAFLPAFLEEGQVNGRQVILLSPSPRRCCSSTGRCLTAGPPPPAPATTILPHGRASTRWRRSTPPTRGSASL